MTLKKLRVSEKEDDCYYTEVGIKINGLRVSLRFPRFGSKASEEGSLASERDLSRVDHVLDDYWTFCPASSASASAPSPPLPPKRASHSAPDSVKPPYPSSTVSRRNLPPAPASAKRRRTVMGTRSLKTSPFV